MTFLLIDRIKFQLMFSTRDDLSLNLRFLIRRKKILPIELTGILMTFFMVSHVCKLNPTFTSLST